MSRRFVTVLLVIMLALPSGGHAATPDFIYREILLELISALRTQISLLERNDSSRAFAGGARIIPASLFLPSTFYSGSYAALYTTSGAKLIPTSGREVDEEHKAVWNIFLEIAGAEFIESEISEFRVYEDRRASYDAFIDQIGRDGTWILAVNTYDLDLQRQGEKEILKELLIHEYGHVLFNNHPSVAAFESKFWTFEDNTFQDRLTRISDVSTKDELQSQYYKNHRERFVSAYATTNPLEDVIETFTSFVLYGSTSDAGRFGSIKEQKLRFIATYPDLREAARRIQGGIGED